MRRTRIRSPTRKWYQNLSLKGGHPVSGLGKSKGL